MREEAVMLEGDKIVAVEPKFDELKASERVELFNKFEAKSNELTGEMLEIMFQKKDYQDMGYNNWIHFCPAELGLSKAVANRRRKAYKDSLSIDSVSMLNVSIIDDIKEINEEIDSYIDAEVLSVNEIEIIKNKCVPKTHHPKLKDATNEHFITIRKRFDEVGAKWVWETFEMPDETFKMFTDKVVSKSELLSAIEFEKKREEFNFEDWTAETLEMKKSLKREREANSNIRAVLDKQEEQRKKRLPRIVIQYESIADIARELIDYLTDNNINIGSFRTQISKELKIRKEAAK